MKKISILLAFASVALVYAGETNLTDLYNEAPIKLIDKAKPVYLLQKWLKEGEFEKIKHVLSKQSLNQLNIVLAQDPYLWETKLISERESGNLDREYEYLDFVELEKNEKRF